MTFLVHVVPHVSHYVVFYTTLPYLFMHSSQLEFRNLDFLGFRVYHRISYGHAMRFLMHVVDHVPHYLVFDTMLPFHSLLSARVSEFGFIHPMS